MPRGYRCIIVAVVGWLILTGASEHKGHHRQQAGSERKAEQSVAASLPVEPPNNPSDTKAADPKCKDNSGAEANCAVVATDAALQQARDADWQAWAAVGGIGIGLLTLIAAGVAAYYARQAANETWRGANEAQRSADAGQDANRPWLELEIAKIGSLVFIGGQAKIEAFICIHNRGASPATNVMVITQLVPVPIGGGIDNAAAVKKVSEIINNLRVHDRQLGTIIFGSSPRTERHGSAAEPDEIAIAEAIAPGNVIYQLGVGVRYRFGDRTGETIYSYTIVNLGIGTLAIPNGMSVPAEQIRLDDNFAGYAL